MLHRIPTRRTVQVVLVPLTLTRLCSGVTVLFRLVVWCKLVVSRLRARPATITFQGCVRKPSISRPKVLVRLYRV